MPDPAAACTATGRPVGEVDRVDARAVGVDDPIVRRPGQRGDRGRRVDELRRAGCRCSGWSRSASRRCRHRAPCARYLPLGENAAALGEDALSCDRGPRRREFDQATRNLGRLGVAPSGVGVGLADGVCAVGVDADADGEAVADCGRHAGRADQRPIRCVEQRATGAVRPEDDWDRASAVPPGVGVGVGAVPKVMLIGAAADAPEAAGCAVLVDGHRVRRVRREVIARA